MLPVGGGPTTSFVRGGGCGCGCVCVCVCGSVERMGGFEQAGGLEGCDMG